MRRDEEKLQIQISSYIKLQHPRIIFTFDASGLKLPVGLAVKSAKMRSCRGIPDMLIFKPTPLFHGLFLEIKNEWSDVYKQDNEMKKSTHLQEQSKVINTLNELGYYATFVFGYDDAIQTIESYLSRTN